MKSNTLLSPVDIRPPNRLNSSTYLSTSDAPENYHL
nr:MAG TPA: hypothetical protein [Bacteriophage sp.]